MRLAEVLSFLRRSPRGPRLFPPGVPRVRQWLVAGVLGALVVASLVPLWDVWQVNLAGILVNRAVAGPADLSPQARKSALVEAMAMMEKAAARGPHNAAHEIPIWRTYGAAASLDPSIHAFDLLFRSRNVGRVDRVGELWLGEVADAIGNIKEAEVVYSRIDASNLLIDRAEAALQAGKKDVAATQYHLAYVSLEAAIQRDREQKLQLDRTGSAPSAAATLMSQPSERVTSLYRIGRGYLQAGQPAEAVKVLEEARTEAKTQSPGTATQQSLLFALAQALADIRPKQPNGPSVVDQTMYAIDPVVGEYVDALIRVRVLVTEAVGLGKTAAANLQAGRILLEIGDTNDGLSRLTNAVRLDAHSAEAYLALGAEYERLTMLDQARAVYVKAVKQLPSNVELAVAYAMVSFRTAPPRNALPLLVHAAGMKTSDPYLFSALGDCYLALGLTDKARAAYLEGLARSPGAKPLVSRLAALAAQGSP